MLTLMYKLYSNGRSGNLPQNESNFKAMAETVTEVEEEHQMRGFKELI
jgi:hypothetical protein